MLEKRRVARSGTSRLLAVLVGFSLILGACGAAASPSPSASEPASSQAALPSPTEAPAITPEPIDASAAGPQRRRRRPLVRRPRAPAASRSSCQAEAEFVNAFNASQKDVYHRPRDLQQQRRGEHPQDADRRGQRAGHHRAGRRRGPEPVPRPAARPAAAHRRERLQRRGRPPELVDFFKLGENNATIGVPFAVYPSFLYYNKDLFDEAGLAYPPTKVGDKYDGKDWDMDTLRELAMKLTVDANGNDATSADFDPTNVVQWGFDMQYADNSPRAEAAPLARQHARRGRRQDGPDPGLLSGPARSGSTTASGRTTSSPAQPDPERPARQGQRVRVGQPRDEPVAQLVHLLRLPGRARRAQGQELRLGRRPGRRRQDHGQAPRRHVQHPQVDQGPGRGLRGPDRPRRLAGAADALRRHAGRSEPAAGVLRRDQRELPGPDARLDGRPGHARLPGHPEPPGVGARTTPRRRPPGRRSRTTTGPPTASTSTPSSTSCRRPCRASSTRPRKNPRLLLQASRATSPTPEGAYDLHRWEPSTTHDRVSDASSVPVARVDRPSAGWSQPVRREALWGYVFIGAVADRPRRCSPPVR